MCASLDSERARGPEERTRAMQAGGGGIGGAGPGEMRVPVARPRRVLHFSDGVEEELEELEAPGAERGPPARDPKTLSWGPWFSHYAWTAGTKVVNTMDYLGEGLAGFFGITTPKYQIEIDEHERLQEEKRTMEEESAGWVPKNSDGEVPLVMNAPSRDIVRPTQV